MITGNGAGRDGDGAAEPVPEVSGALAHSTLRSLLVVLERKGLLTSDEIVEVVRSGLAECDPKRVAAAHEHRVQPGQAMSEAAIAARLKGGTR